MVAVKKVGPGLRSAPRRSIEPLKVASVSNLENLMKISKGGEIIQASTTGMLLVIKREDLVPAFLRRNLTLDPLKGARVLLNLPQLNLEISGKVVRTRLLGKSGYELGIDYSEDAPEYWRECLMDLLPSPGEIEEQ
jgi:hypothetical protein